MGSLHLSGGYTSLLYGGVFTYIVRTLLQGRLSHLH